MSGAVEILERALEECGETLGAGEACTLHAAVQEALAALRGPEPHLPWISVDDRLPHPDDYCYVVNRFGVHEAWLGHDDVWRLRGWPGSDAAIDGVTHWLRVSALPLPQRPQGEQ